MRRHNVLSLAGPSFGTCEPGCCVTLNWLFNPLTAGTHAATIPVTVSTAESPPATYTLVVTGCSYQVPADTAGLAKTHAAASEVDKAAGAASLAGPVPDDACADASAPSGWTDEPVIQRSALLDVSTSALRFGATALQGVVRRLVVVRCAGDRAVQFAWDVGEFAGGKACDGVIAVEPAEGDILPGEAVACQVRHRRIHRFA